jgi:hypothetical protein
LNDQRRFQIRRHYAGGHECRRSLFNCYNSGMKKILSVFLVFIGIFSCSARTSQQGSGSAAPGVRLTVGASPRQGFAPMRVTFHGVLQGVAEQNKDYFCLQEEWDFGDGAKSSEKPNCDPSSAETKVKTEFFADHVYENEGTYIVRLVLGDEKVRSRQISVVVLERSDAPS